MVRLTQKSNRWNIVVLNDRFQEIILDALFTSTGSIVITLVSGTWQSQIFENNFWIFEFFYFFLEFTQRFSIFCIEAFKQSLVLHFMKRYICGKSWLCSLDAYFEIYICWECYIWKSWRKGQNYFIKYWWQAVRCY